MDIDGADMLSCLGSPDAEPQPEDMETTHSFWGADKIKWRCS